MWTGLEFFVQMFFLMTPFRSIYEVFGPGENKGVPLLKVFGPRRSIFSMTEPKIISVFACIFFLTINVFMAKNAEASAFALLCQYLCNYIHPSIWRQTVCCSNNQATSRLQLWNYKRLLYYICN